MSLFRIVDSPLPHEKAEPILIEIFFKDPLFSDYQNVESKEKLHWSSRKIEEWFRRQLKKKNQFATAMEKIFQKHQFLEEPNEALESESGGAWKRLDEEQKKECAGVILEKGHYGE
ncbi:unnamed protein product [Caenorhabditis nigoni]